ncbi:MAG: hypothetical protein ACR2NG_07120 [Acidimicrobiia bacterium]
MSVGHVARAIEEAGTPTVVVMVKAYEHIARRMTLPRTLITPNPMGRPLGAVGDVERQAAILDAAFDVIDRADEPGTIVELATPFRPGTFAT